MMWMSRVPLWTAYTRSPSIHTLWTPPGTVRLYSEMIVGCAGSERSRITIPLRRSEAPSRVRMPMRLFSWIFTSLIRRASS